MKTADAILINKRRLQMKKLAMGLFFTVFLLPLPARSEIKEGSIEVTPFVGYNFFENRQNLENRPILGGRLGYNFTEKFGIEGAMEFIHSEVDDKTLTGAHKGQFRSPTDRVRLTTYHLDLVYHFKPDGNLAPFVLAGIGGANYTSRISNWDMTAFNVDVGAKYWLAEDLALRFDLKDYIVTEIFQNTYHNIGVTIGLTFAFGGKEKPEPVPVARVEPKPEPKPAPVPAPVPIPKEVPPPKPKLVTAKPVVILVAEPKAVEKVIAVVAEPKIEEKVIVLAFEDIHFDFDKSALTNDAQTILKSNIRILKANPKARVRIAGYTSASGTNEYNQLLSERRANAVKNYLINEGVVSPDRLTIIGFGETMPEMYETAPKDIYSDAAKKNMSVLFEIVLQ